MSIISNTELRSRRADLSSLADRVHREFGWNTPREAMIRREAELLDLEIRSHEAISDGQPSGWDDDAESRAEAERATQVAANVAELSARVNAPGRTTNTAGRLAPLAFGDTQLRRLQVAAERGETCRIEVRDDPGFSTADPLIPAERFPYPIAAIHESRILDRLPGYGIETPSITFIRHVSTTGAPAPTAEGAMKPEVIFETDALTESAVKLAANNGLSYEIISDWPAFQSYCGTELYRQIIDIENEQMLLGLGTGGSMTGFYNTSGILNHDCSQDNIGTDNVTALDSVEMAMAQLRTGPALATANFLVLHPATWSALRRIKDGFGHFMVQPDPTQGQADELWGVPVLQTTANPPGRGLLIDSDKMGYVAVRESLSMRLGYSGNDFTQNILRTVAEERLVLCVTRPPAVLSILNLPAS